MLLCLCAGKEATNATLAHGVVMCHAIKKYHEKTGYQVYYYIYYMCHSERVQYVDNLFEYIIR